MWTEPNYADYSKDQLEGVLRRIDREKYPERVAEVERRLKDGHYRREQAPKNAQMVPKKLPAAQSAGAAFILFGIGYFALNWVVQFGTGEYIFDLIPIFAGASLIKLEETEIDKAAFSRWLAQIYVVASILVTAANFIFIQAWDLSLTQFRLFPIDSFAYLVFFGLKIALFIWVIRTLAIPKVREFAPKNMLTTFFLAQPIALGLCVSIVISWAIYASLNGKIALQAIEKARLKLGPEFNYTATHVIYKKTSLGSSNLVVVTAWNHDKIILVEENWRDE